MENTMETPAETLGASAVLAMSMAAARTSTEAEAESDASLVVLTEAVLATGESGGVAPVVGDEMCTVKGSPGPRSSSRELSPPVGMAQQGSVELSMDQEVPASVGSR